MISIRLKDFDNVPEFLTKQGAYRKINKACEDQDGTTYGGYYYNCDEVKNKLRAFSLHKNEIEEGDKPKCYYCESYVEHVATLQVEHYRPKAKVEPIDNNGNDHPGYIWLGLEWSNLVLACPSCTEKELKEADFK